MRALYRFAANQRGSVPFQAVQQSAYEGGPDEYVVVEATANQQTVRLIVRHAVDTFGVTNEPRCLLLCIGVPYVDGGVQARGDNAVEVIEAQHLRAEEK